VKGKATQGKEDGSKFSIRGYFTRKLLQYEISGMKWPINVVQITLTLRCKQQKNFETIQNSLRKKSALVAHTYNPSCSGGGEQED
jgi:hypothetical protein